MPRGGHGRYVEVVQSNFAAIADHAIDVGSGEGFVHARLRIVGTCDPGIQHLLRWSRDDQLCAGQLLQPRDFGESFDVVPGLQARFSLAGHILGAASAHVAWDGGSVLFSGDLGRDDDLLMLPPEPPLPADYVVIESTYGDRSHGDADAESAFAEVIDRTAARGGVVIVPAFAVGRAQTLMYLAARLRHDKRIPDVPIFLNSPMAADVTELYQRHCSRHRLSPAECRRMGEAVRVVKSVEESRRLNGLRYPAVIISARSSVVDSTMRLGDAIAPQNSVSIATHLKPGSSRPSASATR